MVRERGQPGAAVAVGRRLLEGLRDPQVRLGAARGREPVGDRAPHELVLEPVREHRAALLDDEPALHRPVDGGEERLVRQAARMPDRLELEARTGHGRELEHGGGLRLEAGDPLADHLPHRRRRRDLARGPHRDHAAGPGDDPARLDELAPELRQEERVAAGQLGEGRGQLRRRRGAGGEPDELAHLVGREPAEPDPDDALGPGDVDERVGEARRHLVDRVAEGGDEQEARVGGAADEVPEEEQRRRVRPVDVLEHEQDRRASGRLREDVRHRGVEAQPLRVGVRRLPLARPARRADARQQPPQLGPGAPERLGLELADELLERLGERAERRRDDPVAVPVEHRRALGCDVVGELAHEAALARAGLARDEGGAPPLARRAREERPQGGELVRAAGEGVARGQPERARKECLRAHDQI